ncbi:MAG: hypothetical protein PVF89_07895 [Lysobacterales bacterium]|jgi:hypothetical protein
MNRFLLVALLLLLAVPAWAEDQQVMDDGSLVVLPLEAQQCNYPSAPPPIPDDAGKPELLAAQKHVKEFQAKLGEYRACINKDVDSPDLTTGNRQAINNAYNDSVDMEERVAAIFNEAVKAYKARQAGK